jgi:hypothetical protein
VITARSREEIDQQIDAAIDTEGRFSGMTYEEGVRDALQWAIGETDAPPIEVSE